MILFLGKEKARNSLAFSKHKILKLELVSNASSDAVIFLVLYAVFLHV